MPINEITPPPGSVDRVKGNKSPSTQQPVLHEKTTDDPDGNTDRVEVSDQAKALYEAKRSGRFAAIREKIRTGFYFRRDVTEKVVDAMLKDVKKQTPDK